MENPNNLNKIDELAKEMSILAANHGYSVNIMLSPLVEGPREIGGKLITRKELFNSYQTIDDKRQA